MRVVDRHGASGGLRGQSERRPGVGSLTRRFRRRVVGRLGRTLARGRGDHRRKLCLRLPRWRWAFWLHGWRRLANRDLGGKRLRRRNHRRGKPDEHCQQLGGGQHLGGGQQVRVVGKDFLRGDRSGSFRHGIGRVRQGFAAHRQSRVHRRRAGLRLVRRTRYLDAEQGCEIVAGFRLFRSLIRRNCANGRGLGRGYGRRQE